MSSPVLIQGLRQLPIRRPWTVIGAALVVTLIGAYVYLFRLATYTDRARLAARGTETQTRLASYQELFGNSDQALVLVAHASNPDGSDTAPVATAEQRAALRRLAQRWEAAVSSRSDLFERVVVRMPLEQLGPRALLYAPKQLIEELAAGVEAAAADLASWTAEPTAARLLEHLSAAGDRLIDAPGADATLDRQALARGIGAIETFFAWIERHLRSADEAPPEPTFEQLGDWLPLGIDARGFFFSEDGRLLTAYAMVDQEGLSKVGRGEAVAFAERAIEAALAAETEVDLMAGLAGRPALKDEEWTSSQRDFRRGASISLVLVCVLFMIGFGSVTRPALAAVCLAMSISSTFIAAWLLVGHLNYLAMVFTIILVALGIDFAIHFFTHYQRCRREREPAAAILATYGRVGQALWVGGITTAAAFLAAGLTEFPGLAELGVIAGSGLLICLMFMSLVYPAMLFVVDLKWPLRPTPPSDASIARRLTSLSRPLPGAKAWCFVVLAAAVSGFFFGQHHFDTNILNLQPVDGNVGRWQNKLLTTDARTTFAIATYPDLASLAEAQMAFSKLPEVQRVESALPVDLDAKLEILAPVCTTFEAIRLSEVESSPSFSLQRQLFSWRQKIRKLRRTTPEAAESLASLEQTIESAAKVFREISREEAQQRGARLDRSLWSLASQPLDLARKATCVPRFELDEVPASLAARFVGSDGSLALFLYPRDNVWDWQPLRQFVEAARTVDPAVFGYLVAFLEDSQVMIKSFLQAALYALVPIFILVSGWTRSLRATALALVPLLASVGLLLAGMRPMGIAWNFANFFALPILIGVGAAGGIHLVRAWRTGDGGIFVDALRAVVFSSGTTMIGFGVLATSEHRGVASLGLILFLGITFNLVTCLMVLPSLLTWFEPRSSPGTPEHDGA